MIGKRKHEHVKHTFQYRSGEINGYEFVKLYILDNLN